MLTALFSALAPYEPTLVGTFPLGLQVEGSDIDIVCSASDFSNFEAGLNDWLGTCGLEPEVWVRDDQYVSVRFLIGHTACEVYCSHTPVLEQPGFRHMVIEARLLAIGGSALRERVRALKAQGIKTEPAFAELLGLTGDPYEVLLELETWTHEQLLSRLSEG